MWPFKKARETTMAEIVKDKPDVRCGNKEAHYQWTMFNGMACPTCHALKERERKKREQAELAKMIAAELAPLVLAAMSEKGGV